MNRFFEKRLVDLNYFWDPWLPFTDTIRQILDETFVIEGVIKPLIERDGSIPLCLDTKYRCLFQGFCLLKITHPELPSSVSFGQSNKAKRQFSDHINNRIQPMKFYFSPFLNYGSHFVVLLLNGHSFLNESCINPQFPKRIHGRKLMSNHLFRIICQKYCISFHRWEV